VRAHDVWTNLIHYFFSDICLACIPLFWSTLPLRELLVHNFFLIESRGRGQPDRAIGGREGFVPTSHSAHLTCCIDPVQRIPPCRLANRIPPFAQLSSSRGQKSTSLLNWRLPKPGLTKIPRRVPHGISSVPVRALARSAVPPSLPNLKLSGLSCPQR